MPNLRVGHAQINPCALAETVGSWHPPRIEHAQTPHRSASCSTLTWRPVGWIDLTTSTREAAYSSPMAIPSWKYISLTAASLTMYLIRCPRSASSRGGSAISIPDAVNA